MHVRLLAKLEVGISGNVLGWICSFLTNHKERVVISGDTSWTGMMSGVPQGMVLGPLLFLIFVVACNLATIHLSESMLVV